MKTIENTNGYISYCIDNDEICVENIKVFSQRKGTGYQMLKELKVIARELSLPIGLYSYPQDDTINQEELNEFYFFCGFQLDKNDADGRLMVWKW